VSQSGIPAVDPEIAARMNSAPPDLRPERDLPAGFMDFYLPLHAELTPRREALAARREATLAAAHRGHPRGVADRAAGLVPRPAQPDDGTRG
jgi:hypothetical protein